MQGYTPITILETEAEQRRPDHRIIAAAGYPIQTRRTSRQRLGALLVSLGTRLVWSVPTFDLELELQEQH